MGDDERVCVEDRGWRVPSSYDRCRMPYCIWVPVADMARRYRYGDVPSVRWYAYCGKHLAGYGRRLDAGVVMASVLKGSEAHRRGWVDSR